jgi:Ca2+-binding RTX toxin-like protein
MNRRQATPCRLIIKLLSLGETTSTTPFRWTSAHFQPVIDDTEAYDFTIYGSEGDDDIYIVDGPGSYSDASIYVYESNTNFESHTFSNKWFPVVDAGDGDDTIHIEYTRHAYMMQQLTVAGGDGSDTFIIDADFGSSSTQTLLFDEAEDASSDTLDFSDFSDSLGIDLSSTSTQYIPGYSGSTFSFNADNALENVIGTSAGDTIIGNARDNVLAGGAGADTISAGDGVDTIEGGTGSDTIDGGAGNDRYIFDPAAGSLGSDSITEAAGVDSDTLDFSAYTTAVTVDLSSTSAQMSGLLTLSSAAGIENVIGGAGDDYIREHSAQLSFWRLRRRHDVGRERQRLPRRRRWR